MTNINIKNNRKENLRKIGNLYSKIKNINFDKCFYCNDPRSCLDHAPPLSVAINLDLEKFHKSNEKLLLIPACDLCNNMLSNLPYSNPVDRLGILIKKYTNRINKFSDKSWDEDEIEELGYNLKIIVNARENILDNYKRKLNSIMDKFVSLDQ